MRASEPVPPGGTALVTGASGGIGTAVVRALTASGFRVGMTARRRPPLEALARELDGWALPADVTDPAAVDDLARRFSDLSGGAPDLLVTAAGTFGLAPVEETDADALDRNLAVNLKASALVVRAFLSAMKRRGSGTIVQVGSVAGRRAFPGNAAYAASKFGLRGFHEVLLQEIHGTGLRATLLEPAATDTAIWDPMAPDGDPELPSRVDMLRPEDVAEMVVFVVTRPERVQIPYLPVERV
jgi:NADP-dependent 3-hydroxy acid dehydrogenase YdfG